MNERHRHLPAKTRVRRLAPRTTLSSTWARHVTVGRLQRCLIPGVAGLGLLCAGLLSFSGAAIADYSLSGNEYVLKNIDEASDVDSVAQISTLWTSENGLSTNAHALLNQISLSASEGLDPDRYRIEEINQLLSEKWYPALRKPVNQMFSTVFEQLLIDLGQGLVSPREAQRSWFQRPEAIKPELAYRSLEIPGNSIENIIEQHRPAMRGYRDLADALARYHQIADTGGWPIIEMGESLYPGMRDERMANIEYRLIITGDLIEQNRSPATDQAPAYSSTTAAAVRKFQKRHGLKTDGIIGRQTLVAMNTPVTRKIELIENNLERMRWLPRNLGDRHVITNIADYSLRVMDQGRNVLTMPVIVGKPKFRTPVFSDQIEFLVVNPTWTVPKSILYKELLPAERSSPGWLANRNFELIREENGAVVARDPNSIPRSEYERDRFPYTARQKSGAQNALGKIKFIFPNRYSVYLHDTPARKLFELDNRAFSHGCIRVGQPRELAETLLGFENWNQEKYESAYQKSKQTHINLKMPINNHITYMTSWVDEDNILQFRKDIYKHDIGLTKALKNPRSIAWPPIAWPPTVLAAMADQPSP